MQNFCCSYNFAALFFILYHFAAILPEEVEAVPAGSFQPAAETWMHDFTEAVGHTYEKEARPKAGPSAPVTDYSPFSTAASFPPADSSALGPCTATLR